MASSYAVHLARGSSYLVMQSILTDGIQVVTFAILSRLISTEQMGIFAVLLLVNQACAVFGSVSLPRAVTKFVADHISRDEKSAATSAFYQALRITLGFALPVAAAIYVTAPTLAGLLLHQSAYAVYLEVLGFDVVIYTGLLPVLYATFLGLQKFKQQAIILTVSTTIRGILIVALIFLMRNFLGLVVAWVLSDVLVASVSFAYLARFLGRPRFNFPVGRLLDFSWPLWFSDGVAFASSWFDRAILLVFVPLATLGVYNAALTAFSVLTGVGAVAGNTLFSAYSSMQHPKRRRDVVPALKMSTRYTSFALVPLALGLLATAKPALTLFVGQAYVDGAVPLMIWCGAYAVTAIGIAVSTMLIALGETRLASLSTTLTLVFGLILAAALTPFFGMLGAAAARGLDGFLGLGLVIFFLRRKMRVRLDVDAATRSLTAGAVMAFTIMALELGFYSKYFMPIYITAGGVVYLAMLRVLKAVRQEDIDLIRNYLGPKLTLVSNLIGMLLLPTGK